MAVEAVTAWRSVCDACGRSVCERRSRAEAEQGVRDAGGEIRVHPARVLCVKCLAKSEIKFTTVQIGTSRGVTHLEHWPAGVTLCGVDMFPAGFGSKPGFSRGGGQSDWDQPCEGCVRFARRFSGERRIVLDGLNASAFRGPLAPEPASGGAS